MSHEANPWAGHLQALERLSEAASVRQVFGEPVTIDGRTVIPMAQVWNSFGFGSGSSLDPADGAGGGGDGWLSARPVGVIYLDADGVHIHNSLDMSRLIVLALLISAWNVFWIVRALRHRRR